jgi:hypothetical protein
MLMTPSTSETSATSETMTSGGNIMMTTKHHRMSSSLITMKLSKVIKANNKDHNKCIQN